MSTDSHNHKGNDDGCGHAHGSIGHTHAPASFGSAFAIGITLNSGFVILEVVYGIFAHSLALVADAGHNMGDVLGLLLAWGATFLARTAPTDRRTYGLRSSSIAAGARRVVIVSGLLLAADIASYARSAKSLLTSDL